MIDVKATLWVRVILGFPKRMYTGFRHLDVGPVEIVSGFTFSGGTSQMIPEFSGSLGRDWEGLGFTV
jgi:hypothetical protein